MNNKNLDAVMKLLVTAGDEILKIYQSGDFEEESKADQSPVTRADKASSRIINAGLNDIFHTLPVVDEENKIPPYHVRQQWGRYFLLDPLDGTREFLKRNGEFCINLALMENNRPVYGWIYHPCSYKGWYCCPGKGIKEFDNSLNIKDLIPMMPVSGKLVALASRSFFNGREAQLIETLRTDFEVELRFLGSSLKHISLAAGEANLYLKASCSSEWDIAPGQLMVEESGGAVLRFTDLKKPEYNKPEPENPDFLMVDRKYNNAKFLDYLRKNILG